jgi:hypothetical protein
MSRFGDWMEEAARNGMDAGINPALIDVSDVAYACKLWFESYNVPFDGSAVVAMASLVMARAKTYDSGAN